MQRVDRAAELGRAIVTEARAENIPFLAASIAYHAFVSLLPLLVLSLTVASTVGNRALADAILALTERVLTRGASDLLVAEVESATAGSGVSVVGLAVLVWGTLRIFRGLDTAFSDIYESERANTFLDQVVDGLLVFGTFALAVLGASALDGVVPAGSGVGPAAARTALAVGALAVTFLPMFYVFPDEDVSVAEVLPGVLVTAVSLTALRTLFEYYVAVSSRSPTESAVAGVLVFMTFLYFAGLTILAGAVVNAVFSNRSADVSVEPVIGGQSPAAHERETLHTALDAFEDINAETEVALRLDGTEIRLPDIDEVTVERGEPASVTLSWRQSSAGADSAGESGPPESVADADGS
jgi:membrane protein